MTRAKDETLAAMQETMKSGTPEMQALAERLHGLITGIDETLDAAPDPDADNSNDGGYTQGSGTALMIHNAEGLANAKKIFEEMKAIKIDEDEG